MNRRAAEFRVRAAGPGDVPELARLRYRFRTERRPPTETESAFLPRCTAWMAKRLAPGGAWRCWVAESDGQLVGTLWLQLVEKLPNPGDEAETHGYVSSVYLLPSHRNVGAGTALLATCLGECDAGETTRCSCGRRRTAAGSTSAMGSRCATIYWTGGNGKR